MFGIDVGTTNGSKIQQETVYSWRAYLHMCVCFGEGEGEGYRIMKKLLGQDVLFEDALSNAPTYPSSCCNSLAGYLCPLQLAANILKTN